MSKKTDADRIRLLLERMETQMADLKKSNDEMFGAGRQLVDYLQLLAEGVELKHRPQQEQVRRAIRLFLRYSQ
jgi:hypothetical protein